MAIIRIEGLSFKYNGAQEFALSNVDLEIERGGFVVVCGESGCGKSTLLKLLKKQLAPKGERPGKILYDGVEIQSLDERTAACDIGFVMQNPENQIVTDKVWHELAFGLESLGEGSGAIRRKVAEISGYFGINDWYRKRTDELSGGQKQLLNLASVMVMQPKVLILDEPTSQLDPIAASEFIATLKKLNSELGLTIILAEHRLEEVFPIADKVVVMNKAGVLLYDEPKKIGGLLREADPEHKMQFGLPTAVRVFKDLGGVDGGGKGECPLTVRDGREYLERNFTNGIKSLDGLNAAGKPPNNSRDAAGDSKTIPKNDAGREYAVEIGEAFFRYERSLPDVLDGLSLDIYDNEFLCILGANGAGKTTLLNVIGGVNRLYRGRLRIYGKKIKEYLGVSLYRHNVAYLPQNPQILFIKSDVEDDLKEVAKLLKLSKEETESKINAVCAELNIAHLLKKHPYDLSGGEQQKAALAKLLLLEPRLILLDEPTKGIDAYSKRVLAGILAGLKKNGKTVVTVTHDVEFAAEYADRCAMFFDGKIVSLDTPERFFSENNYYTTSASRMSRGFYDRAVTAAQIVELCRANRGA